jgi:hypothetical protein
MSRYLEYSFSSFESLTNFSLFKGRVRKCLCKSKRDFMLCYKSLLPLPSKPTHSPFKKGEVRLLVLGCKTALNFNI